MKRLLRILIFLILIVILLGYGLQFFIKNKINSTLQQELPEHITLNYEDLNVNVFGGNINLNNVSLTVDQPSDSLALLDVLTHKIALDGFSYWDYIFKNKIHLKEIKLKDGTVSLRKRNKDTDTLSKNPKKQSFDKTLRIDKVKLEAIAFRILENESDSIWLKTSAKQITINEITADSVSVKGKIPFNYASALAQIDSLYLKLSPYENLNINQLVFENNSLELHQLKLKTHYSKEELSQIITKEKDHYDLEIPTVKFTGFRLGFSKDTFDLTSHKLQIEQPNFKIYRDKLVTDDKTIKPLYGKMLRNLGIHLMIDSTFINKATLSYSEKVKVENPAGTIDFKSLDFKISNLGNTYKLGQDTTAIHANGTFMNASQIAIDWSFDVQEPTDKFNFNGSISHLPVQRLNDFTEPNLEVTLKGDLNKAYFDIYGNNNTSEIHMRMSYDEFKVAVLNEEKKKKWFTSLLANIFISKDSKAENSNYRDGKATVDRDMTKSFFNYLWLNLKSGMLSTMTGI